MSSNDPIEQKQLGRHIQGFNATEWNHARDALFQSILRAKFQQDLKSKKYLVNTGAKTLAEASLRDMYYGTGFSISNKNTLDSDNWSGKNKLGSMLMIVREELN